MAKLKTVLRRYDYQSTVMTSLDTWNLAALLEDILNKEKCGSSLYEGDYLSFSNIKEGYVFIYRRTEGVHSVDFSKRPDFVVCCKK